MKGRKILVALDGSRYSESATEYALDLFKEDDTEQENLLVGVYVNSLHYGDMLRKVRDQGEPLYFSYYNDVFEFDEYAEEVEEKRATSVEKFEKRCKKAGVNYKVHDHKGSPLIELIEESRFADLIVLGFQTYFANLDGDDELTHELLKDVHCPLLVVPQEHRSIKNLIFTYDGKDSSFYAIKQFTYVMSLTASRKPVRVISVSKSDSESIPEREERLMKEFLDQHCHKEVRIDQMQGDPEDVILDTLHLQEDPLLVMGSYGRSGISMLFHPSTADKVLQYRKTPGFITHR
ncbi:MAG: universal stress protein [Flavobacteriales bacterium]